MKNLFAERFPGESGSRARDGAREEPRDGARVTPEAAIFDLLRRRRRGPVPRPQSQPRSRPELPLAALGTDFDIGPNG